MNFQEQDGPGRESDGGMEIRGKEEAEIFRQLVAVAEHEISELCRELPEALRPHIERVPVLLEDFPDAARRKEGIEPDQLGLFEGVGVEDPGSQHVPRIVLWLGNLWETSNCDVEAFREEVRVTYLHEVGHFLGWNEEDLEARDLG